MPSTHKPLSALADYQHWLSTIKQRVVSARLRVALAANSELIALYYEIVARIVEREAHAQWGSGFIDAFSKDLRQAFPDIGGFSSKNLRYCRAFFRFYCAPAIWQQAVAKLQVSDYKTHTIGEYTLDFYRKALSYLETPP